MPDTKDKGGNKSKVIPSGEIDRRREVKRATKRRAAVLCIAVAAAVALIIFFACGGYEKLLDLLGIQRDVSVTPHVIQVECIIKGEPVISGTGDTLIIYDEEGVTGYSPDGKWKWNEPCSMTSPVVSYCGETVIYTDSHASAVYAFGPDGLVWRYGSENSIKSVFGNSKYICIIHDEKDYLSALTVFEYDGKSSSLKECFTRRFGSHYMLTGAVSQDGKQIAVSGVYSNGGATAGIISFIRMSDGEIFSSESFDENVYVKLFYADNGHVFAVNSDSLRIIYHSLTASDRDDINTELWNRNGAQEMVSAATLRGGTMLMTATGTDEAEKSIIKGYDKNGKESLNFEISGNIINIHSVSDTVMLYTDKYVYLYNENGLLIGAQEAGFKIKGAVCAGSRIAAVYGEGNVIMVLFK